MSSFRRPGIIVLIIAVIGLVAGSVYFGVIPGLGLFENGTDTVEIQVGDLIGNENYEFIGPALVKSRTKTENQKNADTVISTDDCVFIERKISKGK